MDKPTSEKPHHIPKGIGAWLNWHINRGHLQKGASGKEFNRYLRQISHRRKF